MGFTWEQLVVEVEDRHTDGFGSRVYARGGRHLVTHHPTPPRRRPWRCGQGPLGLRLQTCHTHTHTLSSPHPSPAAVLRQLLATVRPSLNGAATGHTHTHTHTDIHRHTHNKTQTHT